MARISLQREIAVAEAKLGTVRIAPSVIAAIVSVSAGAQKGVAEMGVVSRPPSIVRNRTNTGSAPGVVLHIKDEAISVDVYVVADPDANFPALASELQLRVRDALDQMVGMPVEEVNVYVDDIGD